MKHKHRIRPLVAPTRQPVIDTISTYTLLEELHASRTEPLPAAACQQRAMVARLSLESMRNGLARGEDWEVIAVVCNIFEVMLRERMVVDPGGLVQQCARVLIDGLELIRSGTPVMLQPKEYQLLQWLVTDWEECMCAANARTVMRAFRLTDEGQRATSNGYASAFLVRL